MVVTAETLTKERPIFAVNMKPEPVIRVVCLGLLRTSEVVMDEYTKCVVSVVWCPGEQLRTRTPLY